MNPIPFKLNFLRILRYGVRGFRRNVWLAVIAIVTMTMTLMTFTVFAMGNLVAKQQYAEFNKKIDYLIFIRDEASDADVALLTTQIGGRPEVKAVTFITKEEARQRFDEDFADVPELKGIITEDRNPLLREIGVQFNDITQIKGFDEFVRQDRFKELIFATSYQENRQNIDNYLRVTNFLKVLGVSFTAVYTLIAFIVILNTIRLTIHSRREEVEVMRLVGASPGFIRGPFIVEGVIYGVVGALVAAFLTWAILIQLQSLVAQSFALGNSNVLTQIFGDSLGLRHSGSVANLLSYLFVLQLGVGAVLGVICSGIAVRRYLKEQ